MFRMQICRGDNIRGCKKCTNEKSVYYEKMVYERDLCREGEEE